MGTLNIVFHLSPALIPPVNVFFFLRITVLKIFNKVYPSLIFYCLRLFSDKPIDQKYYCAHCIPGYCVNNIRTIPVTSVISITFVRVSVFHLCSSYMLSIFSEIMVPCVCILSVVTVMHLSCQPQANWLFLTCHTNFHLLPTLPASSHQYKR